MLAILLYTVLQNVLDRHTYSILFSIFILGIFISYSCILLFSIHFTTVIAILLLLLSPIDSLRRSFPYSFFLTPSSLSLSPLTSLFLQLSILRRFCNFFSFFSSSLSNSLLFTPLLYSTPFSLATTVSVGAGSAHQNLSPYPIPLPHYTPSLTTPSILPQYSPNTLPIQPRSEYLYARF